MDNDQVWKMSNPLLSISHEIICQENYIVIGIGDLLISLKSVPVIWLK